MPATQETFTRQDGSTVSLNILTKGGTVRASMGEPVVSSRGQFHEANVDLTGKPMGLKLVVEREGVIMLTKRARDLGFMLYSDICKGKIPGVPASEAHWKLWVEVRNLRVARKLPKRGALTPEQLYHPYVIELRTNRSGKFELYDESAVDELIAEVKAQASNYDEAAAKVRAEELGMTLEEPAEDKTLGELVRAANPEAKPVKKKK